MNDPKAIINQKQKNWAEKVRLRSSRANSPALIHSSSINNKEMNESGVSGVSGVSNP